MEVKEIPSTKNKPMFVLENYLFETEKYNGDRFYCRCIRLRHSGCPARAVIRKMPHPTISETSGTHNHGPDEAEVIYRSTSNSMKAAVIAQPEKTLKEVYLGERATAIAELQEDHETEQIGAVVPSFDAVRCVLQRARATIRPPLPESRAEIVLEGDWALNLEGDPFLLFDDGLEDRILGFSTPELLTHMFNADTIFMDGTFRVVPTLFTQLYSLHGFFAGEMIPYVYFLLPDKTNGTYIRMFNLLKNHATSKGAVFAPARFQLDFEQATLRAIEEAFPHSEIKGCHFHFCQSLWRKVQSLGLARFYDDQAVKRFIRCSGALAMVPLHLVEDAWMEINAESPGTDHEAYGALEEYKMYFIDTWLENETVFPRALWNHYANSGPRTTNHVEGWHQSLNSTVKKRHANLFEMISHLKLQEQRFRHDMILLEAGGRPPRKNLTYKLLNEKYAGLVTRLQTNQLTLLRFIRHVAFILPSFETR